MASHILHLIGISVLFILFSILHNAKLVKSERMDVIHINDFPAGFEMTQMEDYPETSESTKPDDVDNDVIEKLVNEFLNKGSLGGLSHEKSNKEAQKLVNTSSYWYTQNLEAPNSIIDLAKANEWLEGYSIELEKVLRQVAVAGWNYFTSASPITHEYLEEAEEVARLFLKASVRQARQFNIEKTFDSNPKTKKQKMQMELITKEGMNVLGDTDLDIYNKVLRRINHIFTNTQICDISATRNTPCIIKYTDFLAIIQNSHNASDSLRWWASWRASAGANLTTAYNDLVKISNKAAKLNGHDNIGAMWRSAYETDEFNLQEQIEQCYEKIRPFYQQLHAYFRPRLAAVYFDEFEINEVTRDGPIPVHLLKSLNGDNWVNHYEQTKPFTDDETMVKSDLLSVTKSAANQMPQKAEFGMTTAKMEGGNNTQRRVMITGIFDSRNVAVDSQPQKDKNDPAVFQDGMDNGIVTPTQSPPQSIAEEMLENFRAQNYTARSMFTKAYRYLKYLGFERLPSTVWTKSLFSRNWSKDMICNPATAYDMISSVEESDFRIKVCSQLGEQDFIIAHKLMIQLYYKYLSRKKPILLRDSPNPSLTSALSSAFGILATNPDYLKGLKLIGTRTDVSQPHMINKLYREALDQFVGMPFSLIADKWRYSVFDEKVKPTEWSAEWWKLRMEYQGVKSPSSINIVELAKERSESDASFSTAEIKVVGKYDAVALPAITQQHSPAGRNFVSYVLQFQILKFLCADTITNNLNQGCIPNKQKVQKIINAMSKGATSSWIDVIEEMTGTRNLDAGPLLEYYNPLISWLKNSNKRENLTIGWKNGKEEQFIKSELPVLRRTSAEDEQKQFILGDEQIAYPGQNCANGQECLLDSVCNGSICVCSEGLFTLQVADTYNCVPGDPASAGFADDSGGLVIALNPTNMTSDTVENYSNQTHEDVDVNNHHYVSSSSHSIPKFNAVGITLITSLTFFYYLIKPLN